MAVEADGALSRGRRLVIGAVVLLALAGTGCGSGEDAVRSTAAPGSQPHEAADVGAGRLETPSAGTAPTVTAPPGSPSTTTERTASTIRPPGTKVTTSTSRPPGTTSVTATIAPAGRLGPIAFVGRPGGVAQIFTMNADGTGVTQVTTGPAAASPAWLGATGGLVYVSGGLAGPDHGNLVVLPPGGPERVVVAGHTSWPSASPDGGRLVYSAFNAGSGIQLHTVNVDGTGVKQLTNSPCLNSHPAWSPDGTKIVFWSSRDLCGSGGFDLYVMNADGSAQTRLTYGPAMASAPAWSPDGRRIAFQSSRDGNQEIYVMQADGSGIVRLTEDPGADDHPSWSPDGGHIVFESDRAGNPDIYVMRADGSDVRRLTSGPAADGNPTWR